MAIFIVRKQINNIKYYIKNYKTILFSNYTEQYKIN